MRKKTKEIKEKEKRLLYYLELCRELQTGKTPDRHLPILRRR